MKKAHIYVIGLLALGLHTVQADEPMNAIDPDSLIAAPNWFPDDGTEGDLPENSGVDSSGQNGQMKKNTMPGQTPPQNGQTPSNGKTGPTQQPPAGQQGQSSAKPAQKKGVSSNSAKTQNPKQKAQ